MYPLAQHFYVTVSALGKHIHAHRGKHKDVWSRIICNRDKLETT